MLRITQHQSRDRLVLKLEGRISRDVIPEVDTSWHAAIVAGGGAPIWVDLSDVSYVDLLGQALLARMHRAGVRFVTRGCLMRELVREIVES